MKKFLGLLLVGILVLGSLVGCAGAEFKVSSLTVTPGEVVAGETVTVKANVENVTEVERTYTATLKIDGDVADTNEVTIEAGAVKEVTFIYGPEAAGVHTVELDGLNATLTVLEAPVIELSSLKVTPTLVLPGQEATVEADVVNVSEIEGTITVCLCVNGVETDEQPVTLAPGASGGAEFCIIRDLPGDYELSIEELSVNLTVAEAETYTSEQYLYSISYPSGWALEDYTDWIAIGNPEIGFLGVDVWILPVESTLDEWYATYVDDMGEALTEVRELSCTEVEEDGAVVAYDAEFAVSQEGIKLNIHTLVSKIGRYAFSVMGITSEDLYEANKPLLDACLESFELPTVAVGSYTNTTHGFSITLPAGWDGMETGELMPLLAIENPVEEPTVIFVYVYVDRIYEDTTAQDFSLDIAELWSDEPNYKIVSQGDATLGEATTGYEVIFTYKENGYDIKRQVVSVIRGTQAFIVMPYTLASTYDDAQSTIDQLNESFTLVEPMPFGVSRQNSLFLWEGEIVTLDPALAEGGAGGIVGAIFSGLVMTDRELKVVPDIAESWEVSADGTIYTFHLQEDATFHNGKPVTAADFKYSWERACDPETESRKARLFLGDIVGAVEMLDGKATEISGIRVIDDLTLEVTIDGPKPYFLDKLAYCTAYVVDRANVAQGMNWTDNPNGTGPFRLLEWQKDEILVLERNDEYYLEPPLLENIVFQIFAGRSMMMYEQGEIDIVGVGLSNLERVQDPENPLNQELLTEPSMNMGYIGFNVTMPPFDDPDIRRAFALALDMDKIIEVSYKNNAERSAGFVPPGIPGHNDELQPLPFDPDQAMQLIAQSQYGSVDNLPPIVFYTLYGLSSAEEAMIGMWQANLGVAIEVEIIEELEEWYERAHNRELQLFSSGWGADYIDPQNFLEVFFHSQSEENRFAYSNPEVDAALEAAAVEQDEATRISMYQEIEKMILEDLPAVPLYQSSKDNVLVKPYVNGFILTPIGINIWQYISIEPH